MVTNVVNAVIPVVVFVFVFQFLVKALTRLTGIVETAPA